MLANKNKDIKKAYDLLEIISQDEKARMAYEAREAEIRDQLTRIKSATMKGRKEGIQQGRQEGIQQGMQQGEINKAKEIAKNLLKEGAEITLVAKATGFSKSEVEKLKEDFIN